VRVSRSDCRWPPTPEGISRVAIVAELTDVGQERKGENFLNAAQHYLLEDCALRGACETIAVD